MINWPEELVESVARRKCVLFLGAGVSMGCVGNGDVRPPSWEKLLRDGIDRCEGATTELRKLMRSRDFLTTCQILKRRLGHDWNTYLISCLRAPNFRPSSIHDAIFRLDSGIVVTPNFDKIYEECAIVKTNDPDGRGSRNNQVVVKKYHDEDLPRVLRGSASQRLILKIHGCIDTPDQIVITRDDYAKIRSKHANFYQSLYSLIQTHTFIFLGCGMTDPDLLLLLEQYTKAFDSAPPHFLATADKLSIDMKSVFEQTYNLKILKYSPKDSHSELVESVHELVGSVDEKRNEMASSMLW